MMKKKIISISLIAIALCSISCRETEEMLIENKQPQIALKLQESQEPSKTGINSTVVDYKPIKISFLGADDKDCPPPPPPPPPNPNTPRDGAHWLTSDTDNCPDPPRDGSHWRMGARN